MASSIVVFLTDWGCGGRRFKVHGCGMGFEAVRRLSCSRVDGRCGGGRVMAFTVEGLGRWRSWVAVWRLGCEVRHTYGGFTAILAAASEAFRILLGMVGDRVLGGT